MFQWILALPPLLGGSLFALTAVLTGLATYAVVRKTVGKHASTDSTNLAVQLFRVVATLLSLLLSLTFADVRSEVGAIQNSIKAETGLLADIYKDLSAHESAEAEALKAELLAYIDAVVDHEWESLRAGQVNEDIARRFQRLELEILKLGAETPLQAELKRRLIDDIDALSESRTLRLVEAGTGSPAYLSLAVLGFLWSTALLGACSTQGRTVFFIGLYCAFVGVVIYFILALGHPFEGLGKVSPEPFRFLSEYAKRG